MTAKRNNKKAGILGRIGIGIAIVALLAVSQTAAGPFTEVPDPDDLSCDGGMDTYNLGAMNGPCLGCIDVDLVIARGLRAAQMVEWLLRRDVFVLRAISFLRRPADGQQRVNRLQLTLRAMREPE